MRQFANILITWLGLCLSVMSWAGSEDELVQQLEKLRLRAFAYKAETQASIDKLFKSLSREEQPRAWIKAYALASTSVKEAAHLPPYSAVKEQALRLGDAHLLAELYLSKALQSRSAQAMDQALSELMDAEKAARESGDVMLTGLILAEKAYTYSFLNNRHDGIQDIEETLALMKGQPHHPHALYAKSTLSIRLYYLDRHEEALRISKEVYKNFFEQKLYYSAAIEAINVGLALHEIEPGSAEAIAYFDKAIELAGVSKDQEALAGALNGKAHAYLVKEPAQAIPLLHEVIHMYRELQDKIFEIEGILTLAEAYLNAGDIPNAKQTISSVLQNPKAGSVYPERTLFLQIRIAEAAGDYESAYRSYIAFHEFWEKRKKEEETAQLNQLSSSLNLKLEEEKNRALQLALGKAEKEKQLLIATLGLCLIIVLGMLWGLWQGYQIRRQKKLLQEIMDSVHEGILRFGADRRIAPPYSRHLEQLLGQKRLNGSSIVELLFPNESESRTMVEACLAAIIDEDRTAWEFNAVHLPAEIRLQGRIVQLYWHPIPNALGLTGHIMLVLRDVTEQRNYEQLLQDERHQRDVRNTRVLELRNADRMQVERFLLRLEQSRVLDISEVSILLRQLHTWKGEARTLGLKELAEEIHQLEGECVPNAGPPQEKLEGFQHSVREYRSLLEDTAQSVAVAHRMNLFSLAGDLFADAQRRLQEEGIRWGEARVRDGLRGWDERHSDLVRTVLLHAISNSLDHGFIRASSEFRAGVQASFEVTVRNEAEMLVVDLYDNGQGIQWARIEEQARMKGLNPNSKDELLATLFLDGFSTADQLSLSSGRGVGLSAIKGICDDHGGQVRLMDRTPDSGAHLEVRLPLSALQKPASSQVA